METLSLALKGMGCGGCVKNVRKLLDAIPGVAVQEVTIGSALLTVDPDRSTKQTVIDALGNASYPAQEVGPTAIDERGAVQEGRRHAV